MPVASERTRDGLAARRSSSPVLVGWELARESDFPPPPGQVGPSASTFSMVRRRVTEPARPQSSAPTNADDARPEELESELARIHILYTRACETAADDEKCREGIFPCQPPFRSIVSGVGPLVCQMS